MHIRWIVPLAMASVMIVAIVIGVLVVWDYVTTAMTAFPAV